MVVRGWSRQGTQVVCAFLPGALWSRMGEEGATDGVQCPQHHPGCRLRVVPLSHSIRKVRPNPTHPFLRKMEEF